jgi:hypothetical protein
MDAFIAQGELSKTKAFLRLSTFFADRLTGNGTLRKTICLCLA